MVETLNIPNFNSSTIEVWEWKSNFIPHFARHVDMSLIVSRITSNLTVCSTVILATEKTWKFRITGSLWLMDSPNNGPLLPKQFHAIMKSSRGHPNHYEFKLFEADRLIEIHLFLTCSKYFLCRVIFLRNLEWKRSTTLRNNKVGRFVRVRIHQSATNLQLWIPWWFLVQDILIMHFFIHVCVL